ncbi:leucine-rich repeat flightless-interacting protein 2 isoform X1 [Bactrocera neohumeralis]|uniref:leucine-rich repeat flightless-interacting protein 2 isoform X1 n=1 Tax=Bactrocera tryoni TaxID=59916 RepID=UPI001A98B6DF|nr:leucine-rich repeat flightless-interacting protein 2 isoform X1 [Bactrocera tryoni]XP_050330152.1 leucine-rich repeat flightless-interacting protein 2 isoform X1 [Bactrocera neohumeralis]
MSDALNNNVLSRVGDDDCMSPDSTDSSNKEKHQTNNDCGFNKKYTTSISTNSNDEIIEEGFDYSEADLLDELNASDDDQDVDVNSGVNDNVERNANIQKYNTHDLPITQDADKKGEACANITGTFSLSNHVTDTNSHDNKTRSTNVVANDVDSDYVPIVSTDNAPTSASDKQKVTPTNLALCSDTDQPNASEVDVDSYCPITPRCIVDVEAEPNPLLKSSSTTRIESNNKNVVDDAGVASNNDHGDEGYYYSDEPEDELIVQFLGEANRIAEARLAARRQARAEAREIRMRELERQQKEQEQNADRVFDMHTSSGIDPLSRSRLATGVGSSPLGAVLNSARANSMSSRRSSEDSLEEEGRSLRDIRHELKDVEERFRKAMIANAQLDNERASQTYQIQLLKDKLEEVEESYAQLQREFKDKSRDCNALKRNLDKLSEELKLVQGQLTERDQLIADQGLVIVAVENEDGTDAKRALVSVENAQLLGSVQGSLDVRLKKFSEEKQQLLAEVQKLQETLENYKSQGKGRSNSLNGPTGSDEDYEAQREANKIISDYKYKLQKAEQEIASLQASLARSETQVIRYKSTAEAAEKAEAELKIERRKLQRENREAMERMEELETSNNHLLKRLDKLKNAKSALLKDL